MSKAESDYLRYRIFNSDEPLHMGIFENNREVLVISSMGEIMEVRVDVYHYDTLRSIFEDILNGSEHNDFDVALLASNKGFVVFIIDQYGVSMFYPSTFTIAQKSMVIFYLNRMNEVCGDLKVFAGSTLQDGQFMAFNEGEELLVGTVLENVQKISCEEFVQKK